MNHRCLSLAAPLTAIALTLLPFGAITHPALSESLAQSKSLAQSTVKSEQTVEQSIGELEAIAEFNGAMPTGVTVSREGRIFINFPRWGDNVPFTVAELVNGNVLPYPNLRVNRPKVSAAKKRFISVQSVVVSPNNFLWVLDTGRVEFGVPPEDGPKLVAIDLRTDRVVETITFPSDVVLPTSYLNDVRFDLRRGEAGMAYITDSSPSGDNALVVVDIATGKSWRRLHQHASTLPEPDFIPIVEGKPLLNRPVSEAPSSMTIGADGIALDATGTKLFYRPLSGRRLYSVDLEPLSNPNLTDEAVIATVEDHGDLGFASDGLAADADGQLYLSNYEDNGILIRQADGTLKTLVHHPAALWPDTLSISQDGYLYFTANQLHRQPGFNNGQDLREKPYRLYRIPVNTDPVLLK